MEKFARVCSVTGKGFNEGYCWGDGSFYTINEEVTIKELRKDFPEQSELTDDELLTWAVEEEDILYWSEWYDEDDDDEYYDEDGNLYDDKFDKESSEIKRIEQQG